MGNKFSFQSKVWRYEGKAGWYFVTLPQQLSKKIREAYGTSEEAWGRLKTLAQIGQTRWKTAIWYDTKRRSYLLPLKSEIRKKESLEIGSVEKIELSVETEAKASKLYKSRPKMWS